MPFQKGHKINVGKKCSEETRRKIGLANSKERITVVCSMCHIEFSVSPHNTTRVFCTNKCKYKSSKGKATWNKGLKGYRAGEKHDWMPKGEKHWSYIKDRTKLTKKQERNDGAYKEWRITVYRRDNFKCKIDNCDCSGRIIAHHILGWSEFPELRYQVNNGITLCLAHHPRKRAEEKRLISVFQELVPVSKEPSF